ncbi:MULTISPECIES: pentapeptide repeat-containing protein [unclassified Moorena]|uniref:pentapeptide repeat-containing protein n=1 Tax=unclassified Moorena TaxID=2683338 RepID=UPI0013FF572A|nr:MULTISPECIES: pentapeptide repeat-containing protein [unclassified Moorena]NEO12931.1 pentapeptide repeat-containing protein [Moorena sp. SIO3E8]NEP99899.1 pentapeptide repeat-containing protein [Moorena sp. SIO3F7]
MKYCSPKIKKKVTIIATPKGLEKAEKALIRLGIESKSNLAKSLLIGRSTVTKFFQSKPIQLDSFKRICDGLKLDWREIAGIAEENQSEPLTTNNSSSSELVEGVEQGQAPRREVTVIDKQSQTIKASIVLEGDIDSAENLKFIQSILRAYSGDSINIIDIQPGSIRLIVEGSPEDIERLRSRIKSGELHQLRGFPVQDIEILREKSEDDQNNEFDQKWRLVEQIATGRAVGRDLKDADLSDADLSDANLIYGNLSGADLSGADLSGAQLSYVYLNDADLRAADLSGADLSGADLSGAHLRSADLRGAHLRDANLIGAEVRNARFENNPGIDESMKRDLIKRGAIFEDFLWDRYKSLTPS